MSWVLVVEVLVLLVILAMTGFIAASETALMSANRIRVRRMVEEETKGAERLETLLEHPNRFLPVILFFTLLLSFAVDSLATTLAEKYLGPAIGRTAATALATVLAAMVVFIYCEVAPKTAVSQQPEKASLRVAGVVDFLTRLSYPLMRVFIWAASPIARLLGSKRGFVGPFVTEEEIKTMVAVSEEEGVIEEVEKEMIHSIFEFGDTVVREVMVPRTDMQTLEAKVTVGEAFDAILAGGHSRIPVWEDSPDNVVGILYAKDMLTPACRIESAPLPREILRATYFVPESKRVSDLLRDMRQKKIHMAIAVEEYGGIAGLVTLEDLIEEIVGEIVDEYDVEEPMVEELGDGRVRVDARMPLEELAELTSAEIDVEDVDSVGGLVYALAGAIPCQGDSYELAGLRFTADRVEGRRIHKVIVEKVPQARVDDAPAEGDGD